MSSLLARTTLILVLLMGAPIAFPQQQTQVIRVGVPVMKNTSTRGISTQVARDHLVKALNSEKPDKKLHLKVQGVALEGTGSQDVTSEAEAKHCDYVVYTTLTELRTRDDPVARPGTVTSNPSPQRRTPDPEDTAMNPAYDATVEYELFRTGDPASVSGAPFSSREPMPEMAVISEVLDRIANRVFAEVKAGTSSNP
jgi:hypothetical protein